MLILLLALLLATGDRSPLAQASLPGSWEGSIDLPTAQLKIAVDFRAESGGVAGTIDIPQQGATGLTLRNITATGPAVRFELAPGGPVAVFDGKLEGDRITGTFTQGPFNGTFSLTRRSGPPPAGPPPPYRIESLEVVSGEVTLSGTLTMPEPRAGAVPAVILITGSGPQNRDEDVFGFKVFATLADHLTRRGIAVYRYDDRGVGLSTGSFATATTEDFASDALAVAAMLRRRPGIDPKRVGLVGHSEGATAAAIAAARSADIAFIVMLSGPALPGDRVLRQQARDIAVARGATPEQVERIITAHRAATDGVLRGAGPDEQERLVRALVEAQLDATTPEQLAALGDRATYTAQAVKVGVTQMTSPWMKFMLAYDPAGALRQVTGPVYAVFGELDTQVPPAMHETPLRKALEHNPRLTVVTYPGANHLFQPAKTGQVTEYASLPKAFVAKMPEDVAAWILGLGERK